jgi:hypothetical protein
MPTRALPEGQSADPKDDDIFILLKNTPMEIVIMRLGEVITG